MATKLRPGQTHKIACSVCKTILYEGQVRYVTPDHQKIKWTPVGHGQTRLLEECPKCQGSLIQV